MARSRCQVTLFPFAVLDHGDRTVLGIVGIWSDAYFDSLAKSVQEPKEAVDAIAFHATTHQGGHLGLIESEELCGLHLRKLALGDEIADALNQFGLGEG
jgi:hypothetical protein